MKKLIALFLCGLALPLASFAIDLKESKFTQIVNDVQIISSDKSIKPASVNDLFDMPDVLRTGPNSRAELVASDRTITRVGANTIFSYDQANRTIDLQQGSLLFHSEKGMGGGTIRTGAATASVLGTTIIASTTPNGGFKLLDLEGNAEIHFLNGLSQHLNPGQMTFILPSGQRAPIIVFRLDKETQGAKLVGGFSDSLSSQEKIQTQINNQLKLIQSGQAQDTGLLVGNDASATQVQVVDAGSLQAYQNTVTPPNPEPAGLSDALAADATVATPALANATPNPPSHIFMTPFDIDPTLNAYLNTEELNYGRFNGFGAKDITISSPTIDLTAYAGLFPGFDMVAVNNFTVSGSVTFSGLLPTDNLLLFAGSQLSIATGSTVEADVTDFEMNTPAALTLTGGGLKNTVGSISINSGSDVTLENSASVSMANGNFNINSGGNITWNDITASALDFDLDASGNITLQNNVTVTAGSDLSFQSDGDLDIDGSTVNSVTAELTALGGTLTLNNSTLNLTGLGDFSALNAVNVTGGTAINTSSSFTIGSMFDTAPITITDSSILNNGATVNSALFAQIYSAGNILITSSPINFTQGGSVTIYGGGTVTLDVDSSLILDKILANNSVSVSSGGNMLIDDPFITTSSGDITISSGGMLTMDTTIFSTGGGVNAGGSATISGANGVDDESTTIDASGGDVGISSTSGSVTLNDSDITAFGSANLNNISANVAIHSSDITTRNGSIDIENGGTLTMDTGTFITANSWAELLSSGNLSVDSSFVTAGFAGVAGSFGIFSSGGGTLTWNDTPVQVVGSVTMDGFNNVEITGSSITANNSSSPVHDGVIDIFSSIGTLTLDNNTAATPVGDTITGGDSVTLSGQTGVVINNSSITAGNDGVSISTPAIPPVIPPVIAPPPNDIDITGTRITANNGGSIGISSGGGELTLDNYQPPIVIGVAVPPPVIDTITADGSATLFGETGVGINDASITANSGSVMITSDPSALLANNIDITGAAITANNGLVTLSSGVGELSLGQDVSLVGDTISAGGLISLSGQAGVDVSDATIRTTGGSLNISANTGIISIGNNSTLEADGGNTITMTASSSGASISMEGGSITASGGTVNMNSAGNITLGGTSLTPTAINASTLQATAGGQVTAYLTSASQVGFLTLNSGDDILLDGGNPRPTGRSTPTGTIHLNAPVSSTSVQLTVENMDLSSYAAPSLSAHTIVLDNVAFASGSVVDLHSALGLLAANPNTGAGVSIGYVNFINNVLYGGAAAQSSIVGTSGAAGIYIH